LLRELLLGVVVHAGLPGGLALRLGLTLGIGVGLSGLLGLGVVLLRVALRGGAGGAGLDGVLDGHALHAGGRVAAGVGGGNELFTAAGEVEEGDEGSE